jgi:predicted transcriptional regulator
MKKTSIAETVKKNLIKYRKNAGLSQVELAKRMKVSQRVVAYYENEA